LKNLYENKMFLSSKKQFKEVNIKKHKVIYGGRYQ
jgi:hypothetical protein